MRPDLLPRETPPPTTIASFDLQIAAADDVHPTAMVWNSVSSGPRLRWGMKKLMQAGRRRATPWRDPANWVVNGAGKA
jgi:hypothetical protein